MEKKDEKIIKELVNEPQIAKSVYVLKTDRNLSDIFKKEDELSISFGEYLSKKTGNKRIVRILLLEGFTDKGKEIKKLTLTLPDSGVKLEKATLSSV